MDIAQMQRHIKAAEVQYNEQLPYHNWEHAQAVMDSLNALLSRMERRGTRFAQRNALTVAAAWHDVRYGGEYLEKGFKSEEAYAAHLAVKYLKQQGVDAADIVLVEEAILATQHNAVRHKLAGLALHRADIDNIGGPYDAFLSANEKLFHEAAILGQPIDIQTHKQRTEKFVTFTINEMRSELSRLYEHTGTENSFDSVAARNLGRYMQEDAPKAA